MQNFATISDPEFINLQPLEINPYMSSCDIKVLYLGENRNRTFISKETAVDMAKTLRGAPIVGYYKEDKEDFRDHGEQIVMDESGLSFNCLTKPYGFVPPDAEVWFQKFSETNSFGEIIEREYLMTKGYLWTGQYEELQSAFEGRDFKNQSMEITDVSGNWETNSKGIEFFIVNDASFSKLCILGDDVEPCFEGANVSISRNFTLADDFSKNLYTMMKTYEKILEEGGNKVKFNKELETNSAIETVTNEIPVQEYAEDTTVEETSTEEVTDAETEETKTEVEVEETPAEQPATEETFSAENTVDVTTTEEYQALQTKYNECLAENEQLKSQVTELLSFKNSIENERKDALIESFSWLEEEDKADVKANKEKYSLDEIEAKLSVISVRKKAIFANLEETEEAPALTYSLNEAINSVEEKEVTKPDWIAFAQSL